VKVAVRFRGEARDNAPAVFAGAVVLGNDRAEKIGSARVAPWGFSGAAVARSWLGARVRAKCVGRDLVGTASIWRCSIHAALFMNNPVECRFYLLRPDGFRPA
jgi:hypothetical protein